MADCYFISYTSILFESFLTRMCLCMDLCNYTGVYDVKLWLKTSTTFLLFIEQTFTEHLL